MALPGKNSLSFKTDLVAEQPRSYIVYYLFVIYFSHVVILYTVLFELVNLELKEMYKCVLRYK